MDNLSLLPFLNNNGNGHSYPLDMEDDAEHEEDELDDEEHYEEYDESQTYEQNQQYPEDEIDEDDIEEDEIDDETNPNEQDMIIVAPPPPPQEQQTTQSERGGRRKGVPRRLQLSPQTGNSPTTQSRLLPVMLSKPTGNVHQTMPTSDHDDDRENEFDRNGQFYSSIKHFNDDQYDENNNHNYNDDDDDNVLEVVDDILADIVTHIVQETRRQRQKHVNISHSNGFSNHKQQTKSIEKHEHKLINGKQNPNDVNAMNSVKSSKSNPTSKPSDPQMLYEELTKMMQFNSQPQPVKQKHPSNSSPTVKRQKIDTSPQSSTSLSLQQQHQQLLWQMTQQLMMSTQPNDSESSSLLKQQLLGTMPKKVGRPPKQQSQPQVMRSSTNMIPPVSHSSQNSSPFERGSFAPRRRGRPPKYVTERGAVSGLNSHDLDPTSYDQLFAAIENSVTGNSARTSSVAFQSALASMLGQQSALSLSTPPVTRNGAPASMLKQSAGQTRHSLPSATNLAKLSSNGNGLDLPLLATKKRGPGRPPKSQMLIDSHQLLQATKRINSSSSLSANPTNNFAANLLSTSSNFNLNAAFVEMLQQQQNPH